MPFLPSPLKSGFAFLESAFPSSLLSRPILLQTGRHWQRLVGILPGWGFRSGLCAEWTELMHRAGLPEPTLSLELGLFTGDL